MLNFNEISPIFNRALALTFNLKKLLIVFIVLSLCGLTVVFFRGLSIGASHFVRMSLTFLPFFLCGGLLLSTGVFLIRLYHNEIKGKTDHYLTVLNHSWEVMLGASYFSIPMIISYLLLWIILGFFLLLGQTPGIGDVIGIVFAFGPFLLNLAILLLCLINIGMLFFLPPLIALKGLNRTSLIPAFINRLQGDMLATSLLAILSLLPMIIIGGLLTLAAFMTFNTCNACQTPLHLVLHSFFVMLPFVALMTPTVVFFFNFAAEAHVLSQKKS